MKEYIRIIPLGGASEIGSNCYYVDWKGKYKFLLDCGFLGEGDYIESIPEFDKADSEVDAILISHAHNDHIGALPFAEKYLLKNNGKIYMTKETKEIGKLIIEDTGKVSKNKRSIQDFRVNLFSEENINRIIKDRVEIVHYSIEYEIGINLNVKFFDAGHILGSSMIYIYDDETSLLYTGDFNVSDSFLHNGVQFDNNLKVDIMISEGTYGLKDTKNSNQEKLNKLARLVKQTLNKKGYVLFPSFALGRAQEILMAISEAQSKGLLPEDLKIYISRGLCEEITEYYSLKYKFPDYISFTYTDMCLQPNSVFIATNGFFNEGSLARTIADNMSDNENNLILFPSGYAYSKWYVKKWLEGAKCKSDYIDFSAHAFKEEIIKTTNEINPKVLMFVHGERNSLLSLTSKVKNSIFPEGNGSEVIFEIKDNNIKSKISLNERSCIITVGASVLSEKHKDLEMDSINNAMEKSAEINTLFSIKDFEKEKYIYHLICTQKSYKAGEMIKKFLDSLDFSVIIHKLKFDLAQDEIEGNIEMNSINSSIARILLRYNESAIILSGGFKFEAAYSYLLGNLFGVDMYYKHEDMKILDSAIKLQNFPVKPDVSFFKSYSKYLQNLFISDEQTADNIYKLLPEEIKNIVYKKGNTYYLTNIGTILYYANKRQEIVFNEKIKFRYNGINDEIFSIKSDRISIFDIKNENFLKFLMDFLFDEYVESIEFQKIQQSCSQNKDKIIFTPTKITNNKIIANLRTKTKSQKIYIKVDSFGKQIAKRFRLEENKPIEF